MSAERRKLYFILIAVLWVFTNAQVDKCDIYGEDYVCPNDTRVLSSVPYDENSTCEEDLYNNVMQLLDDGEIIIEEQFALTDSDEAVMLIGNTGTGKSTLTYFLAGDNSKMFSYEKGTDNFLIQDCNGKIGSGGSTVVSATIYPDLVIENSTGTSFYDNPGFQDTRTACVEIANAYFMQKIANHVKKIKFVIVVNEWEVKPGGAREDFPRALRNVFNFVPNIEKFGRGLGLVATKLDARQPSDDPYIKDIVNFMNESQGYFDELYENPDDLRKASFIVDSIANVSRVGVFRMPSECGPLSEIELMQTNRENIMNVVLNNIEPVESSPDDFALTISLVAQDKVRTVGIELGSKIQNSIQTFSSTIYNYFMFHFTCVQNNNCNDLVEDFKILFSNPDFVSEYNDANFAGLSFNETVVEITNLSFIPPKVLNSLPAGFIQEVVQSAGHLDFMNNLASLNIDTKLWIQPLKDTHRYLKEHVGGLVSDIDQTFVRVVKDLTDDFHNVFEKNLKGLIDGTLEDSSQFEAAVVGLNQSSFDLSPDVEPSTHVIKIKENVDLFRKGFSNDTVLNSQLLILSELSFNLDFLTTSFNSSFSVNPASWVVPLIALKTNVTNRIQAAGKELAGIIKSSIDTFNSTISDYFISHFTCVQNNNCDDLVRDLKILSSNPDFINEYDSSNFESLSFMEIIGRIMNSSFIPPKALAFLPVGFIERAVQNAVHLDFISSVVTLDVETKLWLQPLKDSHKNLKEHVGVLISDIDDTFVNVLRKLCEDFQGVFEKNLKELNDGKLDDSSQFEAAVDGLYESSFNLSPDVEPSKHVIKIKENVNLFRKGFSTDTVLDSQLLILSELSLNLDFLTTSFNSSFSVNPESWVVPLVALKNNVTQKIDSEITSITNNIGYYFSELLLVFEGHYSQLSSKSEEVPYEILDIARRQFDFLNTFTKSVSQGQARKDFITNLNSASNSVNGIFIILGTQNFVMDISRIDKALVVLERLNTDNLGVVLADWVLKIQNSNSAIFQFVVDFASKDINNFVQSGASATAKTLTDRISPVYNVPNSYYSLDKQKSFIADYQKIQGLITDMSKCDTLKCFSSKNFKILTQLTQDATLTESSLQKLPDQNLQVDLNDLDQNPYKISEWIKPYQGAITVLTTIKNQLVADRPILESKRTTNWGTWGSWEQCPDGTFVSGFQLKDDRCTAGAADCVALSGVRFLCSELDGQNLPKEIMSLPEYAKGAWRTKSSCSNGNKAVGFELNVEGKTRVSLDGFLGDLGNLIGGAVGEAIGAIGEQLGCIFDPSCWTGGGGGGGSGGGTPPKPPPPANEATVNMRLLCEDDSKLEGDNSRDTTYGGSWTGSNTCKTGQYLCGLRTQIEYDAGSDDDLTGLNNVDAKCCYIVS